MVYFFNSLFFKLLNVFGYGLICFPYNWDFFFVLFEELDDIPCRLWQTVPPCTADSNNRRQHSNREHSYTVNRLFHSDNTIPSKNAPRHSSNSHINSTG